MARKSSKDAILDATERVIERHGLSATTIEAVAAEVGLSKGGLFYHFASKKELLVQLIERYQNHFYALRAEVYESLPDTPNRLIKATIIASLKHTANFSTNSGNVVALLDDMELRAKVSAIKSAVFKEITVGVRRPELAALAMLAADGLWVMDMFGGRDFTPEFQEKIVMELLRLLDELNAPAEIVGTDHAAEAGS